MSGLGGLLQLSYMFKELGCDFLKGNNQLTSVDLMGNSSDFENCSWKREIIKAKLLLGMRPLELYKVVILGEGVGSPVVAKLKKTGGPSSSQGK